MTDYLFDKSGDDPAVRELEQLLGDFAHRAGLRAPAARRRGRRWAVAALSVGVLAITALVVWRSRPSPQVVADACTGSGAGFAFAVSGGAARCGGAAAARGRLPVGGWLETSSGAVADVQVAEIGTLTVYGDSRVRLIDTGVGRHHLELARGRLTARVSAPPRLFVVDTPVASAIDLGCAYELAVDADGRTRLRVTSGAVSLEGHGRVAYVPIDTEVIAVPGRGPGTPVAVGASRELRAAVARYDAGEAGAVAGVLAAAGTHDAISLWNLLAGAAPGDRRALIDRLEQLGTRPAGVSSDDVMAGDPGAIERWRKSLDETWGCVGCGQVSNGPPSKAPPGER